MKKLIRCLLSEHYGLELRVLCAKYDKDYYFLLKRAMLYSRGIINKYNLVKLVFCFSPDRIRRDEFIRARRKLHRTSTAAFGAYCMLINAKSDAMKKDVLRVYGDSIISEKCSRKGLYKDVKGSMK